MEDIVPPYFSSKCPSGESDEMEFPEDAHMSAFKGSLHLLEAFRLLRWLFRRKGSL
jgi:hypothetical protein